MNRRGLLLLLGVLGGVAAAALLRPAAPPDPVRVATPAASSPAEAFRTHLEAVYSAGSALVDLGERRERNLLVVSQRQAAMNAALGATDAWLEQHPVSDNDPAVAAYNLGAEKIRTAMAQAQAAFIRFDWDAIAAANSTLREGVSDVSRALSLVDASGSR